MGMYITNILIHHLLDKSNLRIAVPQDGGMRHFILTGPNGTGKTTLFNAIKTSLDLMFNDAYGNFNVFRKNLDLEKGLLEKAKQENNTVEIQKHSKQIEFYQNNIDELWGVAELEGVDYGEIFSMTRSHQFVIAFYEAERLSHFIELNAPVKPDLNIKNLKESKTDEFIKFLVDLRFQQAMAQNAGNETDVKEIELWFDGFEKILKRLFDDGSLKLSFDYKHYKFYIEKSGARFSLSDLSAGYSSALDIIADIILKMQNDGNVVRAYDVPGIVFIDEVETHLHLKLQREIMPMLTSIFPKIQFVVTTHSPFVVGSLDNAVVYDLAQQEAIDDLSNYSYDILAEGYFGVDIDSGKLKLQILRLAELADKTERTQIEDDELQHLLANFGNIPDVIAPNIKARYYEIKCRLLNK